MTNDRDLSLSWAFSGLSCLLLSLYCFVITMTKSSGLLHHVAIEHSDWHTTTELYCQLIVPDLLAHQHSRDVMAHII